jgi:hypothetical protein
MCPSESRFLRGARKEQKPLKKVFCLTIRHLTRSNLAPNLGPQSKANCSRFLICLSDVYLIKDWHRGARKEQQLFTKVFCLIMRRLTCNILAPGTGPESTANCSILCFMNQSGARFVTICRPTWDHSRREALQDFYLPTRCLTCNNVAPDGEHLKENCSRKFYMPIRRLNYNRLAPNVGPEKNKNRSRKRFV